VGISVVETLQYRHMQAHIHYLGQHVNRTNLSTQKTLAGLRQMFMMRGANAVTAEQQALGAVWGMVQRQASMLSYNDVFRFLGGTFLLMLPLIFLLKKPRRAKAPSMAH
jgi:MFS transporter, DHA2 family, multidrug resistance protein